MSDTIRRLSLGGKEYVLLGTAHVSRESVEEVARTIREEQPGRVCVEIDENRYKTITEGRDWKSLRIDQVLKKRQGFLLMANLVLTSFQRRMGGEIGVTPGDEMKEAVSVAKEEGIPFSFSDRDVAVTLRRAWAKSGFWNKNKMLATLLASLFSNEKVDEEEIERLKQRSALEEMMGELAEYLPSVKQVLIDERDQYLATRIFESPEEKVLAVVGAGHMDGICRWLEELHAGSKTVDLTPISEVPPPGILSKTVPWVIPAVVLGLLVAGFWMNGFEQGIQMLWMWILVNGSLAAVGAALALAHPLTVLLSFVAAPITSMNPTIGVGIVSGLIEGYVRRPRVQDFENLHDDIESFRGFYRNRFTKALLVFVYASVGSMIGTFIGIPYLSALLGG
jgi:pheromone shutdown-related protein TraB